MKKNKYLYILILVLIIVNAFFIYRSIEKPSEGYEGGHGDPMAFIVKQLGFNDKQQQELQQANRTHRGNIRHINRTIKRLKDELFNGLTNPSHDSKRVDSLTTLIGMEVKQKDVETYNHLRVIQNLCTGKQKEKFQEIIKDALHKHARRGRMMPPPNSHERMRRPPPSPMP